MTASRGRPSGWLTLVLVAATGIAAASYHSLLKDGLWWLITVGITALVFAATGIARRLTRRDWAATLIGIGALVLALTLFFGPASAILGVIPTFDTVAAFGALTEAGIDSITTQGIPADATAGIVFLLVVGFSGIALLLDLVTFTVRRPALAGVPLLLLIAVPSLIDTTVREPVFFVLMAAAYFVLILAGSKRSQRRLAVTISAIAIVGALILSITLPPVLPDDSVNLRSNGYTTGLDPFLHLGEDLRRGQAVTAIEYTTDSDVDQYFTLTVLKDFTGNAWQPVDRSNGVADMADIGPVPGRAEDATTQVVSTDLTIGNIAGRWLVAPYPASSVTGLDGTWEWNPETLAMWTSDSNLRNQDYSVTTVASRPTAQELYATGTAVPGEMDDYLDLPSDLPPIVAETATEVVGDAGSNYEKALALQKFFRSDGDFTYSEEAPVEQGYDGSSAEVIATFLDVRSGYCVHFASAFATMARTLGMPARIGVGFTSGESSFDLENRTTKHTVTTDDLHAWPEIYFNTIGWVRFEPTVTRGSVPNYGVLNADDPATPEDERTNTPTPTPTQTPTDAATPRPTQSAAPDAPGVVVTPTMRSGLIAAGIAVLVVLLLLVPLFWRTARRSRRLARVRASGSALDAWTELRDTATDLGLDAAESETPRAFATYLSARMTPEGVDPLGRLLDGVETSVYGQEDPRRSVKASDLRGVLVALRRHAGARARVRARLAPASILSRWRTKAPAGD